MPVRSFAVDDPVHPVVAVVENSTTDQNPILTKWAKPL